MPDRKTPSFSFDPSLAGRVRVLVFGRLALIFLIILAGLWWAYSFTAFPLNAIPARLLMLFLVSVGMSCVYVVWLRLSATLIWQIRLQFLIDTLLITWLVRETGDLISPYITLYIILISVTGFFLSKSDVHLVAAACALCFAVLTFVTAQSLMYSISGEVAPSRAVQIIAFNVAAFLLVGLLAGRLADRRQLSEELRKAEEDFADLNVLHERILASINSGLITTDLQGKIYAFNRAAEEISGLSAAKTIGQNVLSVFGDEIRAPIEMCLGGVQTVEFSPPNFEAAILALENGNGAGRQITVACSASPLVGKSGGVTGLIIAFQDKTELHAMEETLRRADRLAVVGRMAAGLAHEIRNPLGSMSSALQFLAEKEHPAEEDPALMNVVLRESERLNKIITDFLAYARPQTAGQAERESEQMDVGEAMTDCLTLLRHDPGVRETHIFEFERPKDPVTIRADETQMKQVFWNLLQNSIQATPDGGRISVEVAEPNTKQVRIVFADDGCGIPSENMERVFEPFHSGSNGTGLGLSIVHRIVTERGGRIDVESEPGAGTKVTVELPR